MEKPNLTKISLQELLDSERIIYEEGYALDYIPTFIKKPLSEGSSRLKFYVDKKTELSLPLRLILVNGHSFVPNIPIHRADFQGEIYFDNTISPFFDFGARYTIMNVGSVWESWFGESESGWRDTEEMVLSESCTKRTWNKNGSKVDSFIKYVKYKPR